MIRFRITTLLNAVILTCLVISHISCKRHLTFIKLKMNKYLKTKSEGVARHYPFIFSSKHVVTVNAQEVANRTGEMM